MLNLSNEKRTVMFNGEIYPESGWCVILVGGPGCGRRAISDGFIPISGSDSLNENTDTSDNRNLPNIIFDLTGSEQSKITDKAIEAKELGYKVSLVYVLHTIEWQLKNNSTTAPKLLKTITREVYDTLRDFVNSPTGRKDIKDLIDEVWAVAVPDAEKQQTVIYKLKGMNDEAINLDVKAVNAEAGDEDSDISLNEFIVSQYDKIPVEETTLRYRALYYYGDD